MIIDGEHVRHEVDLLHQMAFMADADDDQLQGALKSVLKTLRWVIDPDSEDAPSSYFGHYVFTSAIHSAEEAEYKQ